MSTQSNPLDPYCQAMEEHILQTVNELQQLTDILQQRSLSVHEYHSAERLLQVLVEAVIGLAKHWCKALGTSASQDAYQTFSRLHENAIISDSDLGQWRRTIGLRNALVHDYLNIDRQIILEVIKERYYQFVQAFAQQALQALRTNKGSE